MDGGGVRAGPPHPSLPMGQRRPVGMQPSYCQTDYYFARGDPTDIGKRPAKGTLEFEKQSVGKCVPVDPMVPVNEEGGPSRRSRDSGAWGGGWGLRAFS